jgi:DNA invertase Pin-like site-specific DNA recombinase
MALKGKRINKNKNMKKTKQYNIRLVVQMQDGKILDTSDTSDTSDIKNDDINSIMDTDDMDDKVNDLIFTINNKQTGLNINSSPNSSSIKLGQKNVYLVDNLCDVRVLNGVKQYLVKWEGYETMTWEPEDNINSDLIRNFLLNQQIKKHNDTLTQGQTQYAHIYLRVSDSSKTKKIFNHTQLTNQNSNYGSGSGSYQSYFSGFPEGNLSLDSQKEMLMKYCVDNKLMIKSIEMDDGVSARDPLKLKGLNKIIDNILNDEVLLILDFSRFSRNTQVGLDLLNKLDSKGAHIYSVLDGMNYDTPSARHCVRTTLSCAQMESDLKSIKLKATFENIKNKGGFLGKEAPFGYKIVRINGLRKLEPNTYEQKILKEIKELAISYSNNRFRDRVIADKLNNKNIKMRGKAFNKQIIRNIMKKEFQNYLLQNYQNKQKLNREKKFTSNRQMDTDDDE